MTIDKGTMAVIFSLQTNMDPKQNGLEEAFPFNYMGAFCVHVIRGCIQSVNTEEFQGNDVFP